MPISDGRVDLCPLLPMRARHCPLPPMLSRCGNRGLPLLLAAPPALPQPRRVPTEPHQRKPEAETNNTQLPRRKHLKKLALPKSIL